MKISKLVIVLVIILGAVFLFAEKTAENGKPSLITPITMKITSPAFKNNEKIPPKFTCDADNINPELIFSDVPENTKSLSLITHDPDAPMHGGWTHWTVINMDPLSTGIKENNKPISGLETTTDFGTTGYGGPCPPSGSHHYFFYLYALDTILSLGTEATKRDIETAMEGHVLAKTELVGVYKRQ